MRIPAFLESALRETRVAARRLWRSPRFTLPAVLVLSFGIGVGAGLLSLAAAGLGHPEPVASAAGVELPGAPIRPEPEIRFSALDRFLGAGRGLHLAPREVPELQRDDLSELLRTTAAVGWLAVAMAALNLSLLLIARGGMRRGELALRSALGASRRRLLQPLFLEGLFLAVGGAVLGLIAAAGAVAVLRAGWSPALAPWLDGAAPAVAVAAPLMLLTALALLLSIVSVRRAADPAPHLAGGGRLTGGPAEGALRRRLAIAAIAGSVVLVVASGLLMRGFARGAAAEDPVFKAADTLTLHVRVPAAAAARTATRAAYVDELLSRIAAVDGVESPSLASHGAWFGLGTRDVAHALTGEPGYPGFAKPARYHAVSPGFFAAMGIPLTSGREFGRDDAEGAPGVAVVNEVFASRLLPGLDPIGKKIQIGGVSLDAEFYTIVGVVPAWRTRGLGTSENPEPAVFFSTRQAPPRELDLALRPGADPALTLGRLERALSAMDPAPALSEAVPMRERVSLFAAPLGWFGRVFAAAALLSTVLAALGLYGVISYGVAQRTRELGVRAALGAAPRDIVWLVVRDGLRLTAIGAVIGLAGALCAGRLLRYLFYGVDPLDPIVYPAVLLLLGLVSLLASWGPARAAARLHPAVALRAP